MFEAIDTVDPITPSLQHIAPAATALAAAADGVVFERWRREAQAVVELLDQDGSHDPADDLARNRLSKADTIDQTYHLRAQLIGELGLTVTQTIDEIADELWRQYQRDEDTFPGELRCPSRATLEALALVGATPITSTSGMPAGGPISVGWRACADTTTWPCTARVGACTPCLTADSG